MVNHHHIPKTPEKNKQASDLKIDLFDTIDQILDFSSTTTYKVLDSLIDLSFEKNDLNSNNNNNNSDSNQNQSNNIIEKENKDISSLISDIDTLVFDLNDIEDDLRKSCTTLYRLSCQTTSPTPTSPPSPPTKQQPDQQDQQDQQIKTPEKEKEKSNEKLGKSFDICEVFSYDSNSSSGPSSPNINNYDSPLSSPPLSPKVLSIRTQSLNQIKVSPSPQKTSTNTTSATAAVTTSEIPIKTTTSAPSSPKWIHGSVGSGGSGGKSSLSSSASSIKSLGSSGEQDSSSVSTSISSSIGGSPLTLSGKLKNHIWRKSNQVGPIPSAVNKSPSSSSLHQVHPRSITDPSKFSFGRESIVNLDPVNSNNSPGSNSNTNNNNNSNNGSFKHRSTFPGSIPNDDYKKNPTQILANEIPVKSLVLTNTTLLPVALSDSISSLPSPPLQSILPCIIFDEKGYHKSDLKEELSKNPSKKRIDLENPTKVKKLKELLKNYRNKIIGLHNKFSQEVEDLNQRKYQQHQKYSNKVRFFCADHQYPIIELLRTYYSCKISCTIANVELDKKRNEFLKRKLKDISHLIKVLDETFTDSQSGSPTTSGTNSLNSSTNLLPQLNLTNICTSNNNNKKNIIVYSSFFLQMEDLLDHISFSKFTKRLKLYNDKFISEKLNYKLYYLNHYKRQNEEDREKIIKSIISQAKCHHDLPLYYPWDLNQEIQKSFSQIIRDSRFIEGRQIQQLLHLISEDCTSSKKIKPIDIEVFIEKFCERMISSFHLLDGLSNSGSGSTHSSYTNSNHNLNHNEELEKEKFQKIYFLLNQLTKRSVYPEIYPLLKVILIKEVGGQSIKYDFDLCERVNQLKNKSPRQLNLLPTNFPDDYEWPKDNGQLNPFHHAISTLNDLAFFMVPVDLIYTIQQTISSIYSTCTDILNSLTFGENYQKILEKSSLLTANTRHHDNHHKYSNSDIELSSSSSSESSFLFNNKSNGGNNGGNNNGGSNISVSSSTSSNNLNLVAHSLSADDLFPIFIYVLMNSDIVGSSSMISHLIQQFSSELENSGEFGWCSVSFQAALTYLNQLE